MTDIDQDVKHGRILDEGMKHLTNDKVRLEDLKKLAEESDTLIQRLVKIVLTELLKNVKEQTEWSIQHGAPPPDIVKTHFMVQTNVVMFTTTLLKGWQDISLGAIGQDNEENLQKLLDRKGWK